MKRHRADDLADAAISFLIDTPDNLYAFLNASGLTPEDLHERSEDKAIRLSALEFIGTDEALAKAFSGANDLKPGDLQQLLAMLDAGGQTTW